MNGLTPPKSGATEWPPGSTPRASRGAPEPRDAFAGILDSHQARTATAEGQDRSPKDVKGQKRRDDDAAAAERAERKAARRADRREADGAERPDRVQHHADEAKAQPANPVDTAATAVAEAQPVAPVAVTPPAVEAVPAVPVEPQTPTPTQNVVAQQPQAPVVVAAAPEAAKEQPAVQQQQQQPTQEPVVAAPQADVATEAVVTAEVKTDDSTPQLETKPAERPAQQVAVGPAKPKQQSGDTGSQQQQGQQPGTLPQPAAEQARTVAQAYGRPQQTSNEVPTPAQSGTPAASPATSVAGGQPAAAARGEFAPATPVPLSRAAENVEHVLRLAANRGVTHARIALNPESLGSVDVHLRHTSDGLVATVVAHSPEAVQQLQQAAADLRRQLEGQGVNLLSLDIGQSADERAAGGASSAFADAQGERNSSSGPAGSTAGAEEETTVKSTLQLPNGVLVDVLA